jgi:hypothetical protein
MMYSDLGAVLGGIGSAIVSSYCVQSAILGVAVVMWICVASLNAAAHRKDSGAERSRSIAFYALTAAFFALLVQATFFQS